MRHLILLGLLTACGADPAAETAKPATDQPSGGIEYQPDPPKEVVVEYRKYGDSYAVTVSDTSELPACERSNSKQLAWVKTTEQFFSCENESWVEVPMKKPEAVAGSQGQKGDKGDPGADGKPVPANQWFDPITGRQWLIGASVASDTITNPCSNGWSMPPSPDLQAAIQHGLSIASVALTGPAIFWSADFLTDTDTYVKRVYVKANGTAQVFTTGSGPAGIACLKGA